jgi:signal peptidase I
MKTTNRQPCTTTAFAELSRELLESGTSVRFCARGASMSPLIRDGDAVLVQPPGARNFRIGDVVILRPDEGRLLVHRVVRRQGTEADAFFTTQGDQAPRPDGAFRAEQLFGRVVAIDRGGSQISLDEPAMRLLGQLAVLCSRSSLARAIRLGPIRRVVRRVPIFSRYVA